MLKKPLSDFYVQRYHIGNYVMCEREPKLHNMYKRELKLHYMYCTRDQNLHNHKGQKCIFMY